jgi:hypothetical protein
MPRSYRPSLVMAQLAMEHANQAVAAAELLLTQATDVDLGSVRALDLALRRLELSSIALLRMQGHPWESMAEALGVSRQALHYRVAKQVHDLQQIPLTSSRRAEVESAWANNLDQLQRRMTGLRARGLTRAAAALRKNAEPYEPA